jgi:hypothetical protein
MDLTALIIQLISGALGGNAAGAASKDLSLGPLGNSIAGALGRQRLLDWILAQSSRLS